MTGFWHTDQTKRIFSTLMWVAIAGLFFIVSVAAVKDHESHVIQDVEYNLVHLTNGNDLITIEEIKDKVFEAYKLDLAGVEIDLLDLKELEEILLREAFIVSADAYIDARSILHLDIQQRTPIVRIMTQDGSNFYLDAEGVRLPLSKHFTARVPVVTGAVSTYRDDFLISNNSLKTAYNVVNAARQDKFLDAWLESVFVRGKDDLWLTGNLGSFKVIFGDDQNIDRKFHKLKAFFKDGLKVTGWKNLESINLKFDMQVVAKSHAQV